ncbi:hypothetical protein MJO28_002597 [Puccinia striiformis f. sp. tritici]|uniref:Uncharacterized protein n=4 Tax=Puccinia striiformis TaxID=27350 RepID=A0A0L0V8P6_9BASI|nr:hypothetical protein Pst134EA_005442 [Puccinia striiformis f. sp. tritici]KAI9618942.1 hypothetical protein H4Q26_012199 [Puccinia striiformis f. sp. tritici PST-130]KNE95658.1 hypothetical protein PSTG_11022 [Puccinia striiformis f. sp. tritici PST-78]POV95817.1 hypothetical protein PSTT_16006 [Puccinia striiformis]KAH9462637.1 hypothetical protein Pst134EB_006523 [Puccinia striiformis f. sp. tritici]KAH9471549.1 hypothetical protein Pst134EA_005442 [Puccinia striiformis f. sp. tritici]
MSSDPEAEKRGLPNLNKAQILEDLECLSKNRDFERQLSSKTPTTKQSLEEFSLTQVQLPLPSDRPQQPQNLSDAVNSAVQLLHLNHQLTQRGSEVEQRKIGDRLEDNRRKLNHLLRALDQSSLLSSSQPASSARDTQR